MSSIIEIDIPGSIANAGYCKKVEVNLLLCQECQEAHRHTPSRRQESRSNTDTNVERERKGGRGKGLTTWEDEMACDGRAKPAPVTLREM